jgi:hypothetical protein
MSTALLAAAALAGFWPVASPSGANEPRAWVEGASSPAASRCPRGYVRAVIANRPRCLKVGVRCARRLDTQYHRYRFHCHSGRLKRLSRPEQVWVGRTDQWARGLVGDTRDALDFLPDWLAQRDRDSLLQLAEFARVIGGCGAQLREFGSPPTRRLLRARELFESGCVRMAQASALYAELVNRPDETLVSRAAAELDEGLRSLDAGIAELARQPR